MIGYSTKGFTIGITRRICHNDHKEDKTGYLSCFCNPNPKNSHGNVHCLYTNMGKMGGMERESPRCPFHLHVFVKSIRKTQFYLDQRKEAISAT